MRLVDGRYECAHCGAAIEIDPEAQPIVVMHAASGQPNVRVITVEGHEVHRCEVNDRESNYPRH